MVQIFIIYFGLGQIEYLRTTFLWVILKEPYWCAIIAFTLNTGAYTSEILRSAFQTIKQGIIEAGKSLGISNKIIFYKIQIPIAIRQSLPAYGNEIILMMKGTSLASTVTLMDLTGVAKYIISTTFKPIEVFIVAGGIYSSTIDWEIKEAKDIPIEERNSEELSHVEGMDENNEIKKVLIYPNRQMCLYTHAQSRWWNRNRSNSCLY